MGRIGFLAFVVVFYLAIDTYTYGALKQVFTDSKLFKWIYWGISLLVVISFFKVLQDLSDFHGIRKVSTNLMIGFAFSVFVAKFVFSGLMLFQDIARLLLGLFYYVLSFFGESQVENNFVPGRRKAVTGFIAGMVSIPFISLIYAFTKGKYQYEVKKIKLAYPDLPDAFEGAKIVQISDIHSGSYDSYEQVLDGIKLVNNLNPDYIFFTGDLVNSDKDEIDPFISAFAQLEASEGKYSITGNHDYYGMPRETKDRNEYWLDFKDKHRQMGFNLLTNSNIKLSKGDDYIRLIGVENWGRGPFPKIGDLDKASVGTEENEFTILLSHDPSHWEDKVMLQPKKIHLTLSGHTHGMQFGISALGVQWSPIKYRYERWSGLYEENGMQLYVNRGFGFLGFPGRVGMWPEITEFTLSKA